MGTAAVTPRSTLVDDEVVAERMAFVDGAMGAAGHQVSDPYRREVLERFIRDEITIEEAMALGDRHIAGQ